MGTLAYATDTEKVRVKKISGWADVGSGAIGTVTEVDGTHGIVSTNPTGPVVTLTPTYGTTADTFCQGNDSRLSDSRTPTGAAGGDLGGTYPNPTVAAIHETAGPTKLTIGAIAAGQILVRSGTTVVGQTGAAPTGSAGGDLSGSYPNPNVAALHETSGPTQLTIGAITDGRLLYRNGSTVIGRVPADFTQQTAPNNLDKIIISDSAASDAIKYMTLGALVGNSPFTGRPITPDAWNFEARLCTNPDLAANGWSITLLDSPYTTQTRAAGTAGNIDLSTSPAANTYRSQLAGGLLWLQFPDSSPAILIYKATTSAAFSYRARAWQTDKSSATAAYLSIMDNPQRKVNLARSYTVGVENSTFFEALLVGNGGAGTFTIYTNGTPLVGNPWDGVRFIDVPSVAGNNKAYIVEAVDGRSCLDPNVARANSITVAYAGVFLNPGSRRSMCFVDFIRRQPYLEAPGFGP